MDAKMVQVRIAVQATEAMPPAFAEQMANAVVTIARQYAVPMTCAVELNAKMTAAERTALAAMDPQAEP